MEEREGECQEIEIFGRFVLSTPFLAKKREKR